MVGLHEDLHAATQVPAQLVGSAAACMRWWRLSWHGPDGGPAGVLGKGLAEAPAVIPGKALAGGLMVFLGWDPAKGCRLLSPYLILNVFTKICMLPRGCLPIPCPLGAVDSRVICSVGAGRVAVARVLPGLLELSPGKDLAGGVRFVPIALRGLGLGVVLVLLSFGLTLAHLPCLAWCGGIRGSDCPCTVIGVRKVFPSFCTPTPREGR